MITTTLIISIFLFALSASITPGPNNIMLTASGANYGYIRSMPHLLGIVGGFMTLQFSVAAGLGALFTAIPALHQIMKIVGSLYLLYLAYRIATAPAHNDGDEAIGKPFTFFQAAAFQFVNPKAWIITISAMSSFTLAGELYWTTALLVMLAFAVAAFPSMSLWIGLGVVISAWLKSPTTRKAFNLTMGGLTAACVLLIAF